MYPNSGLIEGKKNLPPVLLLFFFLSRTAVILVLALDHSRLLGLENKFFPHKITQSPTDTTFNILG